MKDLTEVKATVITKNGTYRDVTFYNFKGITTADKLEQLQCCGIYDVTGIIEHY